jgi:hypothetical protein
VESLWLDPFSHTTFSAIQAIARFFQNAMSAIKHILPKTVQLGNCPGRSILPLLWLVSPTNIRSGHHDTHPATPRKNASLSFTVSGFLEELSVFSDGSPDRIENDPRKTRLFVSPGQHGTSSC